MSSYRDYTDFSSSLVEKVLVDAWRNMREEGDGSFTVVVVDSRPLLEG